MRGEEGRWRRVGTLHVLSWHPPSNLHPAPYPGHSTSFSHPSPSPRGKQFSSSSQNPVTPRRAHPETDDKVHPATPAYLRFHPLVPPPSPCVDERVHIYIYIHMHVYVYARDSCTHVGYLCKKSDEEPPSFSFFRRPLKKEKGKGGMGRAGSVKTRGVCRIDRVSKPIYQGFFPVIFSFLRGSV